MRVAAVPFDADQLGEQRRGEVDRIPGQVRIGDVTLHAADAQLARERAAAAVLDRVAEAPDRGRLADDAVVGPRALRASSQSQTRAVPSSDGPSSSLVIRNATPPA